MAHNIFLDKETGKHSVMTQGSAWHGLGEVVVGPQTAAETIYKSGIDFDVVKQPLFLANGIQLQSKFATVRTDTGFPLGVVGKDYKLLQNIDAFDFFDGIVNREEAIYTSAGVLGNGERVWLQAKLPEHVLVNGEQYNEYLLFSNTHDGTSCIEVRFTPIRVVCENTMNAALRKASPGVYKVRHSTNAKLKLAEGAKVLGMANTYFKELENILDIMAHTRHTKDDQQHHFKQIILGKDYNGGEISTKADNILFEMTRAMKQCPDNEKFGGTWMETFNGITYYADHWKSYKVGDSFEGSIFGTGAIMRNRSMELAMVELGLN
jgi:phage/plasmid-like protein (TIGR03299 family)